MERWIKCKKKRKGKKPLSEVKVLTQGHTARSTAATGREPAFLSLSHTRFTLGSNVFAA